MLGQNQTSFANHSGMRQSHEKAADDINAVSTELGQQIDDMKAMFESRFNELKTKNNVLFK